jgi:hypothetical protein
VFAVALLATTATLSLVPTHETFAMHRVPVLDLETTCAGIDTVRGTTVRFHGWAASSGSFGAGG